VYTVIFTGGKQYSVSVGSIIKVEKLPYSDGSVLELKGMCFSDADDSGKGGSSVKPATVIAKPIALVRSRKIIVFKKKRRHNYRRKKGHKQTLLQLQIEQIVVGDDKKVA